MGQKINFVNKFLLNHFFIIENPPFVLKTNIVKIVQNKREIIVEKIGIPGVTNQAVDLGAMHQGHLCVSAESCILHLSAPPKKPNVQPHRKSNPQ